jgi:hypothetical protein
MEKNRIGPLLEGRKALEDQWGKVFHWQKTLERFTTGRDFFVWLNDEDSTALDGLKVVLTYAAHHAGYLTKYADEATRLGSLAGRIGTPLSSVKCGTRPV